MNTELNPLRGFILPLTVLIGLAPSLSKAQPANDLFAARIVITGTNVVVAGSSVGATRESGEPYHAGLTGGASVWWSWTAPSAGTVTMSTAGSSFDTVLGVYTGSLVSALTAVASDDDDPDSSALTSKVVFVYVVLAADASQYLAELEEARHGGTLGLASKSGSSNYAFGDGSVRVVRYGQSLCPLNLWAVTDGGRADYAVCRPH